MPGIAPRIPISKPTLVYPLSLIHRSSPHPELAAVIQHFTALEASVAPTWRPSWATRDRTSL